MGTSVVDARPWLPTCIYDKNSKNYTWPDGGVYIGEARVLANEEIDTVEVDLLTYQRHGRGKHIYTSGARYIGEWKDDLEDGKGTFYLADGAVYVGNFRKGMFHGSGIITYADGSVKSGSWEHGHFVGLKHNKPHIYSADEIKEYPGKYDGEYKNGMKHGWGTYVYPSGAIYVGEWENDAENGRGTFTLVDGTVYVGEFKDGKYHGNGTLSYKNGEQQSGEWKLGKYIG